MTYYDPARDRLVYIRRSASPDYWDQHWNKQSFSHAIPRARVSNFVCFYTRKHLAKGAKVLEAGCGRGQFVLGLAAMGYDAHGVDFAPETVRRVREAYPDLQVRFGDVRALPYGDAEFDGYWSLGVIEHFYEGYERVLLEAKRVLKPGGYAFVTFPHLSRLRRLKARLGRYPRFEEGTVDVKNFYQFALNERTVIRAFEEAGFELVATRRRDGLKGLKDEVEFLKAPLRKFYNARALPARLARYAISLLTAPWTSHSILLILRYTPSPVREAGPMRDVGPMRACRRRTASQPDRGGSPYSPFSQLNASSNPPNAATFQPRCCASIAKNSGRSKLIGRCSSASLWSGWKPRSPNADASVYSSPGLSSE
jgi:SAM-dependent methyltransferase